MKILDDINISETLPFIDKKRLFVGVWQLKGSLDEGERAFGEIKKELPGYHLRPRIIFERFRSTYDKGFLSLYSSSGGELAQFEFNDDIFKKFSGGKSIRDEVVLMAVTIGDEIKDSLDWNRERGDYKKYFYLSGFAAALAEALTEYGHVFVCKEMGWNSADSFRLSPGYPAWPELLDQVKIDRLVSLNKIGIAISETLQMHPEYSTTSMLFGF